MQDHYTTNSNLIPNSSGVYRITCIITGKFYVGSSTNLMKRWRAHRNSLRRGDHHSPLLQRSWDKYTEASFVFDVLELVLPPFLLEREQYWLDKFKPFDPQIGYNIAYSSQAPMLGKKYSAETREKLRQSHLGNTSALGHKVTPEGREKMRVAKLGKKHSEEHTQRVAEAHRGTKHSAETREKLRTSALGRVMSPETKEKLRVAKLGKKHSEETRKKLSEAGKGRTHSPETARKLGANLNDYNAHRLVTIIAIAPDGTEHLVHGVYPFCKEHCLDSSALVRVAQGRQKQHRGWRAFFPVSGNS